MSTATPTAPRAPAAPRRGDGLRTAVGVLGELLVTLGLVVLLFIVYQVYVTDLVSAGAQREATEALDERWAAAEVPVVAPGGAVPPVPEVAPPVPGEGFAKLYIPAFGADWVRTVLEGVGEDVLSAGPGHYPGTALPGRPGNVAIAGHRVGNGAPFDDLHRLSSCDALVVETERDWFAYRLMPFADEVAGWATGRGTDPRCRGVAPLTAPYDGVVGQEIVLPSQGEVIAPVPGRPGVSVPPEQQAALLTLTTCHPRFSARQRLVVHAVLVAQYPKDPVRPDLRPAELTRG